MMHVTSRHVTSRHVLPAPGRPPFNGANHIQLLQNIERHEPRIHDSLPAHLSSSCRHLISTLLRRLPEQRITFEEFFNHPFFQGGTVDPHVRSSAPVALMCDVCDPRECGALVAVLQL